MKKIVVTGATSYIARNLIKHLIEESNKYYIYAVVRDASKVPEEIKKYNNIQIIELEMTDYKKLPDFILSKCDVLIHFAWRGARGKDNHDIKVQEQNYKDSLSLMKLIEESKIKKFIQIGSLAQYGNIKRAVKENTKCTPKTPYGNMKYEFGRKCARECEIKGISYLELRMGSVYGRDMENNTLIKKVTEELKNGNCYLSTECLQKWEFIYIDDVIKIIKNSIDIESIEGIYNVSNGETQQLKKFLEIIEHNINKGQIHYPKEKIEKFGCDSIMCDVKKLKEEFNISSFTSFEQGIKSMIGE